MHLAWPLTGRSEEMRLIEAALTAPDSAGVVVCGAVGVGKSRVAREAVERAASNGCETRWAVGTSSARTVPLGAFASWAPPSAADTLRLVRGVIEALTLTSTGAPVVVGVDDVHLLDDLSVFVLHQIVQRGAAKVVLTVRTGESVPPGMQEIWTGSHFHRIDLQPISRDETTTLLSATLGGSVDPDAARRLWNLTRGNVLYLRNIVEQEAADRRLTQRGGHWTWTGEPTVPSSLVEMIEARTGALPPAVGEVIDALAVGEPIELPSLCAITDAAAVEQADVHGLIKLEHVDGRIEVRVAHPLYAEVRRKCAPATRLRRLRGRVATELALGDDRDDMRTVVRRAALTLDSDLEPDPDLLVRATYGAVWMADLPLAERLAEAAIRAGGGAEAYIIRGCNLSGLSRGEEADAVLAQVPASGFTGADHARLAFIRGMNAMFTLADPARAKALVDEVSLAIPQDARLCIDAFLAVYWAMMGSPELALKSSQGLDLNELPAVVGAQTAALIAAASGEVGRTTDAVAAADAGYAIVDSSFDAENVRFVVADGHVGALLQSGRIAEALVATDRLRRQWADLPGILQVLGAAVAGRAALGAGRLETAGALLEPVDMFAAESNGWGYRYFLPRTMAFAMRGMADKASAALDTAERHRHPSHKHLDYELGLARAWVAASQGVVGEAISIAHSAAETAAANGQFAAEVMCLQTATQFGDAATDSRLRELARTVEGPRVGLATRFAGALRAGDGAELAAVSEDFEQIGDLVAALDAAGHAAMACRREDRKGSALTCSARADSLAALCGGARTPALRHASERLPLSDREHDIAVLVGQGLSSREISERLTVSVRTVEGHIYRAMAKTGAKTRDELAAMLPRG